MKINVGHVAKLANLPLKEEEKKKFEKQLSAVLDYVKKLEEVDTSGIEPTSQTTGLEDVSVEDVAKPVFTQEEVLNNKKDTYQGFFKVKGVFENE